MAYDDEVTTDSPVAYWKMGEASGSPQDSSGQGNHLTMNGSPTYGAVGIPGSYATSIDFTAAGQYGSLSSLPAVLQLTTWTLEGWFYSNNGTPGAKSCLITEPYSGDGTVRYMLGGFSDLGAGTDQCNGGFYTSGWKTALDPTAVTSGAWHHFVTTYDGTTVRLYRNGVEVATLATTATPAGSEALRVAGGWDTTNALAGRLAHLAIYSGALSATRIAAHYNAGSGYVSRQRPMMHDLGITIG